MANSKSWKICIAGCALLALLLAMSGCKPVDTREPVPEQPYMPLTASWSAGDSDHSR